MRTAAKAFGLGMALVALVCAAGAWVQVPVAAADLGRLDATVAEVDRQIKNLEKTDPTLAKASGTTLADLRDEVAYLRVKLRRDGAVTRAEFGDVRDRLETLRVKVQGQQKVTAQPVLPGDPPVEKMYTLPVGTELDVRLTAPLSSRTAKLEQRFEATTVLEVLQGGETAVPAGALVRGFVSSVRPAGRIDRTGSLTLSFDELVVGARISRLRASVVKALDPSLAQDATRVGAGAVVGAVLGGLIGGGKGALLGVLIGGGGTIASTEGSDVELAAGTVLRIRLDQPLEVWQ